MTQKDLHAAITLSYKGKITKIENVIVDTGAAHTLISADAVFDSGIFAAPEDELTVMSGIGGEDFAFRKVVDRVEFAALE
ncbi:aspartyl protease family protein [Brevibacillus massiliensis]|uniref:aspartyl protease family protein n=1 Tax=Brevibacillus massiliensis TaxID=1118054 RepID=UPI0002DB2404|nr:aspartyl protease family protein [Brevibacillus massiliensis]